jgi:hypothetical protein
MPPPPHSPSSTIIHKLHKCRNIPNSPSCLLPLALYNADSSFSIWITPTHLSNLHLTTTSSWSDLQNGFCSLGWPHGCSIRTGTMTSTSTICTHSTWQAQCLLQYLSKPPLYKIKFHYQEHHLQSRLENQFCLTKFTHVIYQNNFFKEIFWSKIHNAGHCPKQSIEFFIIEANDNAGRR